MVRILWPSAGSAVFGRQVGCGEVKIMQRDKDRAVWRHDGESFRRRWEVVGEETETRWKTWVELDVAEGIGEEHWGGKGYVG